MARVLVGVLTLVGAENPLPGSFDRAFTSVTDDGLEAGSGIQTRDYQIAFPKNASTTAKFPLIVYAHGAAGGGVDMLAYNKHLGDIASYGFVVIAPKSCFMGCSPPGEEELMDGFGCYKKWPSFVFENTRAIEFSKNSTDEWASLIDWQAGVGTAGHSMGGEVVSQMASQKFAETYNVKAAVCQHCLMCIETGDLVSTPAMYFTGTTDYEVTPKKVKKAFTDDKVSPKSYRNQKGKGHLEMLNLEINYNPAIASHTAAFFNVWLKGDQGDFYEQVYGKGDDSFCGYADMKECEHSMESAVTV